MCWILDLGSWIFCFGICAYIHAYIHASWILDLLCWILFVFFHWIFCVGSWILDLVQLDVLVYRVLNLLFWILFVFFHLGVRMFCFCSLFGSSETTVLLCNTVLGHRLNGVWAFVFAAMPGLLSSNTRLAFRKTLQH